MTVFARRHIHGSTDTGFPLIALHTPVTVRRIFSCGKQSSLSDSPVSRRPRRIPRTGIPLRRHFLSPADGCPEPAPEGTDKYRASIIHVAAFSCGYHRYCITVSFPCQAGIRFSAIKRRLMLRQTIYLLLQQPRKIRFFTDHSMIVATQPEPAIPLTGKHNAAVIPLAMINN